tara:strand:- start:1444 stop:1824 length:381 start_codon:yes stop_codon:yes gene_type:complete
MINNFLIISCIGSNDRLGLRINKDFFVHTFKNKEKNNDKLVSEISNFFENHKVNLDNKFSVIVNQGPGSFSSTRISLAVAKGMAVSQKVRIYGYKNSDLVSFDQENIEKLIEKKLIEKKLIKPLYS